MMKLTTLLSLGLALGLRAVTALEIDEDIPFEPSENFKDNAVCGQASGEQSDASVPEANWIDCINLHVNFDYNGGRGNFSITDDDFDGEYRVLMSDGTCKMGLSYTDDSAEGVKFGDQDVMKLIQYAVNTFSTDTGVAAHGTLECTAIGKEGNATLGWSIFDDKDAA
jgi:hypothetical protein